MHTAARGASSRGLRCTNAGYPRRRGCPDVGTEIRKRDRTTRTPVLRACPTSTSRSLGAADALVFTCVEVDPAQASAGARTRASGTVRTPSLAARRPRAGAGLGDGDGNAVAARPERPVALALHRRGRRGL